jgi:hypothetical protein
LGSAKKFIEKKTEISVGYPRISFAKYEKKQQIPLEMLAESQFGMYVWQPSRFHAVPGSPAASGVALENEHEL